MRSLPAWSKINARADAGMAGRADVSPGGRLPAATRATLRPADPPATGRKLKTTDPERLRGATRPAPSSRPGDAAVRQAPRSLVRFAFAGLPRGGGGRAPAGQGKGEPQTPQHAPDQDGDEDGRQAPRPPTYHPPPPPPAPQA